MQDLMFIGMTIGFFAVCIGYTYACGDCEPWKTYLLDSWRWDCLPTYSWL